MRRTRFPTGFPQGTASSSVIMMNEDETDAYTASDDQQASSSRTGCSQEGSFRRRKDALLYLSACALAAIIFPVATLVSLLFPSSSSIFLVFLLGIPLIAAGYVFKFVPQTGDREASDRRIFADALREVNLDPSRWMVLGYVFLFLCAGGVLLFYMVRVLN